MLKPTIAFGTQWLGNQYENRIQWKRGAGELSVT